jgi:predicted amidophosphoribosyltransferase
MKLIEHLLVLLAPHECLGCACEDHLLCAACYERLPVAPPIALTAVDHVWPGVVYGGAAKEVVHSLKFERAVAAAQDIASHMAVALPGDTDWIVTHIPTASVRVRQRGYDQSQRIARLLAGRIHAPYLPLLGRMSAVRQVGATRAERRSQMHGAFRPLHGRMLQNRHVLVVDDVLTTGSTVQAAAQTLRAAGASRVSAVVFASA